MPRTDDVGISRRRRSGAAAALLSSALVLLLATAPAAGVTVPPPARGGLAEILARQVKPPPVPEPALEAVAALDAAAARAALASRPATAAPTGVPAAAADAVPDAAADAAAEAAADAVAPAGAGGSAQSATVAAPADACSGPGWQQRRGRAALAALGPAATGSGFAVEFAPARSGYLGLAHLQRRVVEVFVRDCDAQSDELLRHVLAHELGHAFDTVHLDDATRSAWKAARGIPATTPWYGCDGCTDFATPAGDFAEVYAQWLRGASDNRSRLGAAPGPAQLDELASRFFAGGGTPGR